MNVFSWLTAADLCSAALVCRLWFVLSRDPRLWRDLCFALWPNDEEISLLLSESYRMDWHRMRCRRPYLRTDGIYCGKVSYLRRGQAEWTFHTPVQTVVYYRYLRFYPDGTAVWAMSFDAPVRPRAEHGEMSLLELVRPQQSAHVAHAKQGKRMTIHCGVYSVFPFGENRDEITVAVRGQPNSTFMLTLRLHRSRHKHLLQWLTYYDQPDAPHLQRTWFNTACNDLPVLQFMPNHLLE